MKKLIAALVVLVAGTIHAHAGPEEDALTLIFTAEHVQPGWFTQELREQASAEKIDTIVHGLTGTLGAFQGVQRDGDKYTVFLERGRVPAEIALDAAGRVKFLFFSPPKAVGLTPQEAINQFAKLVSEDGRMSVLVMRDGADVAALSPDLPLDVGSAFKLAVLRALDERIRAGEAAWDDVIALKEEDRSLPSGMLQDWPAGTPMTLAALATLMISISDNTATDALIDYVGRDAVERFVAEKPLLKTTEFFKLKANADNIRARYRAAETDGRRAVLEDLKQVPLPEVSELDEAPSPEIGWYFTTRDLCGLMETVGGLPLMGVNPGPANPDDWAQIAFKGGSNFGAINLTNRLVDRAGVVWCVSATWNTDREKLDNQAFQHAFLALVGSLTQDDLQ